MPLHLLRMTPTESRAPEPVMVNPLGRTGRKDEISFHEELSEEQLVTIHTPGKPPELKGTIASYRRSEVQLLVWCLRMILGERSKPSIYLLSSSLKLRVPEPVKVNPLGLAGGEEESLFQRELSEGS
ncbi:PREDICTED: uncharacterized protein LOC106503744 isoform X1 [Capra hircus]|uniref:uncharacterized protein LOC106503744 isoform X1 n=1 Tax=Capra hircus TaxID=9925 RepID=UPI0006B13523|nr:PREDICTED: uncharacterized protein LOC106503744 isoform X1 [Capra hircus]